MLNICYVFPIRKNLIRNFIETPLEQTKAKQALRPILEYYVLHVSYLTMQKNAFFMDRAEILPCGLPALPHSCA